MQGRWRGYAVSRRRVLVLVVKGTVRDKQRRRRKGFARLAQVKLLLSLGLSTTTKHPYVVGVPY